MKVVQQHIAISALSSSAFQMHFTFSDKRHNKTEKWGMLGDYNIYPRVELRANATEKKGSCVNNA
jgi:hypothetical protein